MKKIFGTGKLVMYDDPFVGMTLCVILADGMSGYASETKIIYVVYCFKLAETFLAYEAEIYELENLWKNLSNLHKIITNLLKPVKRFM